MFKKLISMFSSEKGNDPIKESIKPETIIKLQEKSIDNDTFVIDFISIRSTDETIKKAIVLFPEDVRHITINGDEDYFDAYYINDEGMSSDNKYHRIATPDFKFWVLPKDYKRFLSILNDRHIHHMERKKERFEASKIATMTPFTFDDIDEEIYKCFISNKAGMCDAIGTWEQFAKAEEEISKVCQEKNGKYYKSPAKSARFAIVFDPHNRIYSNVSDLKSKGYKVTTFEDALKYFGLTHMWNCNKLSKFVADIKKQNEETYG